MRNEKQGASDKSDRATAAEPVVSALRDGIPSALIDLVGDGVLAIVPTDIRHPLDPNAQGVIFSLNDRTYLVFEDPNDGYRSCAAPLLSFAGAAYEIGCSGYSFPTYIHEAVFVSHRSKGAYGHEDNVLEFTSKETGELIFEIGTENIDDYYPGFVYRWRPEGLSANAKVRAQ